MLFGDFCGASFRLSQIHRINIHRQRNIFRRRKGCDELLWIFSDDLKSLLVNLINVSDEILRYTDLAAAIQLAKSAGMTTREIVRELTGGMTYGETLIFAKRAAPLLDMGVMEFMRLRKNE